MAAKKVVDIVFEAAKDVVSNLGFVLVDCEYVKKQNGMNLTCYIDKEDGSVTLDDCEKVSKSLDVLLDELDPTKGASYYFNVSSMGLDRPITTDYQFNKFMNEEIEIKFYKPFQPFNEKLISAVLKNWNDDEVEVLEIKQNLLIKIPRKEIAQIVPVVKF